MAQYAFTGGTATAIARSVEEAVDRGRLRPGEPLPSVRDLAVRLRVSPATVSAALRTLRERGVVVTRPRSGARVADRPPLPVAAELDVPDGAVDLGSGNPDLTLLPDLASAWRSATPVQEPYGQEGVIPELAEAAAARFAADGVGADHLAVVAGAMDGVERVLAAHLRLGDAVGVEDPAYPGVLDLVRAMGLRPVPIGVDARGPVPEALEAALAEDLHAVVLAPRAQNPTGAALTRDRARELRAALAAAPRMLVVEDDHAEAVAGAPHHPIAPGDRPWAVVRSVGKSLGPDLRLAVLAGDAETVRRVRGRQQLGPGWVSRTTQRLVVRLWGDAGAQAAVRTAAATYDERRRALSAALASHGIAASAPSGLNLWIPVRDEEEAVRGMAARGWAVRAGAPFRLRTPPAIRVTAARCPAECAPEVAADLAAVLRPRAGRTRAV